MKWRRLDLFRWFEMEKTIYVLKRWVKTEFPEKADHVEEFYAADDLEAHKYAKEKYQSREFYTVNKKTSTKAPFTVIVWEPSSFMGKPLCTFKIWASDEEEALEIANSKYNKDNYCLMVASEGAKVEIKY